MITLLSHLGAAEQYLVNLTDTIQRGGNPEASHTNVGPIPMRHECELPRSPSIYFEVGSTGSSILPRSRRTLGRASV